ncbi:hypothetical protein ACKLNR_013206 [Fusarium oxysporum f. sp. zingiberi]
MGSTSATSRALYADEDGKIVVRHVPFPEPQEGELLIKVLYSGVNPADTKIIDFFGLKNYVVGTEFCGEVLESETLASTSFKAGDIVAGVHSGGQNPPVRVFEGSGEDAIKEVYNVKNMSTFGKLVLKHPLK